jgi:O-antigen ligase
MQMLNIKTLGAKLGMNEIALFLTIMIVFWAPFSGGARPATMLLAIVGLIMFLVHKKLLYQNQSVKRWGLVFLMLWIPMWVSLVGAYDTKNTLSAIAWFSILYFSGVAIVQALQQQRFRTFFTLCMVLIAALWFLDSTVQYLFGKDLIGRPMSADGRVTGPFTDLHQGIILATVLPLISYYFFEVKKFWLAIVCMLAVGLLMVLSGSRGYLYIFMLLILGMIIHQKLSLKKSALLLSLPFIVAIASYQTSTNLMKTKMQHSEAIAQTSLSTFDKYNLVLSKRLNLWETGAHMFLANPINGVGTKNFKKAYPQYVSRADDPFADGKTHAHHVYVELLAETGLIGLAGLIGIMYYCRKWYKNASSENQHMAWPFVLPLMVFFFPINTIQPMMVPWWFPMLMLLVCGFIASLDDDLNEI